MPRKSGRVPSYCHHKASGRAVVRIDGRDHYLGPYGSDESHAAYERLIAEWRARRVEQQSERKALVAVRDPSLTVAEVILRYREFAAGYYVKDGKPSKEFTEMGYALKPVRELYGTTLACEFGPLELRAVQQHMIEVGLSRGVINNRVNRIKRFCKWAVSEAIVPPAVYEGVRAVAGLKKGRTAARETDPVTPVADADIDAAIPFMSPQVAAMVRIQRLTGMRPGEVVMLRGCELDRSGDTWIYRPSEHKNAWRDHDRTIPLGPKAQDVVRPFLKQDEDAFLFSPREAEEHRNALRRSARKTPLTPSQKARKRKAKPKRPKRDRYSVDTYRKAIGYAVKQVNKRRDDGDSPQIPDWFPLQLRHSRATQLNELFGIEAAAVGLGHAHADVTKVYAERNLKLAIEVARKTG